MNEGKREGRREGRGKARRQKEERGKERGIRGKEGKCSVQGGFVRMLAG